MLTPTRVRELMEQLFDVDDLAVVGDRTNLSASFFDAARISYAVTGAKRGPYYRIIQTHALYFEHKFSSYHTSHKTHDGIFLQ